MLKSMGALLCAAAVALPVPADAQQPVRTSGGPVLGDTGISGVAFQAGSGENIGYMVPAPVIENFLTDIQDGRLDGSPIPAIEWQLMENPQLRRHYGLAEGQSGVLLTKVEPAFEGGHHTLGEVFAAPVPGHGVERLLMAASVAIAILGILVASWFYARRPELPERLATALAASRFLHRYGVELDVSRLNADHPVDLIIGGSPTQRLKLLDESINKSVGASLLQAARKANLAPGDPISSVVFIKR